MFKRISRVCFGKASPSTASPGTALHRPQFSRGVPFKVVLALAVAAPLAFAISDDNAGTRSTQAQSQQVASMAWIADGVLTAGEVAYQPISARLSEAGIGTGGNSGEAIVSFDEGRSEFASESHWRSLKSKSNKNQRTAPNPGSAASLNQAPRSGVFTTIPQGGFSLFPQKAGSPLPPSATGTPVSGTYRTLCVRLCDGYYWPISFATGRDGFRHDAAVCENSCGSPARLFVYNNPGSGPEQMVDLKGRRYDRLKTAWLYRETYSAQCTCQPHPWEEASLNRHRKFAELQQAGKLSLYASNKSSRKQQKNRNAAAAAHADLAAFLPGTTAQNGGLTQLQRGQINQPTATRVTGTQPKQSAARTADRPLASVVFGDGSRLGVKPRIKAPGAATPVKLSAKPAKKKSWQSGVFNPDR